MSHNHTPPQPPQTARVLAELAASIRAVGTAPLRISVLYGGVPIDDQLLSLKSGADILVATPGRLLDVLTQRGIFLSDTQMLVLDEADRYVLGGGEGSDRGL